jgi:hypothetical protein
MKTFILALAAVISPAALAAQDLSAWRQDLKLIAEQVPARHPNAFYRMSRSAWDSAVADIDARLSQMNRSQAMVAFMQLIARIKDGHTAMNPLFDAAMNIQYYPVEFHVFDDGLYIKAAAPKHASIVGAKVTRFGKVAPAEAITRVGTTISHENEWFLRAWAGSRLNLAEILYGLDITDDPSRLELAIERDGRSSTVTLEPAGILPPATHGPLSGIDKSGWTDMRGASTRALWTRNQGMPYWWEFSLPDSTLYVSYRGVISMPQHTNEQFWAGVFAASDTLPLKRMVIDLRENPGGNSFYNRQVVRGIVSRPKIDQPGKLFAITTGMTFSAAMNLVQDLEAWTNVTFIGEPTGNATVFFGDHAPLTLPGSGLTVNISTLPWYPVNPRDKRDAIVPQYYTPMTAAQYRAGEDPAMKLILARGSTPSLAARVELAVLAGDSATALAIIREESSKVENRFRSVEPEVNALGYRLLPSNAPAAIRVFRLNTLAFPHSANVWDSLGEALVQNGQRDAGIAAYRKALEIAPGFPSATAALSRLQRL